MIQTAPISASSRIVGYRGRTADKQYGPGAIPAWFMTWYTLLSQSLVSFSVLQILGSVIRKQQGAKWFQNKCSLLFIMLLFYCLQIVCMHVCVCVWSQSVWPLARVSNHSNSLPFSSSRPGRPPKRAPVGLSLAASHLQHQQIKKHRIDNGDYPYENGHMGGKCNK